MKVEENDVWLYLPHFSIQQFCWMMILCYARFCDGFAIIFPLFGQYTPAYFCTDRPVNELEIQFNNTCHGTHANGPLRCFYEKGRYQPTSDFETIPTAFALTCDRAWINALIVSLHRGGQAVSGFICNWMVLNFGLRDSLITMMIVVGLIYVALPYSASIILVCFFKFVIGLFGGVIIVLVSCYSSEMIGPSKRRLVSTMAVLSTSFGIMFYSMMAYYLPDWQDQCKVIGVLYIVFLCALSIPRSFQNAYGRGLIQAGSENLRHFAERINAPLAETTIRKFEYHNFLASRQKQREDTAKDRTGTTLYNIKKRSNSRESIFAQGHMMLLTIACSICSFTIFMCLTGYTLMPDGTHYSHYIRKSLKSDRNGYMLIS